jgi:hypothetical protein
MGKVEYQDICVFCNCLNVRYSIDVIGQHNSRQVSLVSFLPKLGLLDILLLRINYIRKLLSIDNLLMHP